MASSLQEQLLKSGLVSEAELNRSKKQQHKTRKRAGGKRRPCAASAEATRRREEKKGRDKALNEAREKERHEKELRAQVRELIVESSMNQDKADVPYNVVKNGRIRRIYVTAEQRDGLSAGALAITSARGRHHVVPADIGERIHALLPEYFVYHVSPRSTAEDDEYAQYKVPDDLTW